MKKHRALWVIIIVIVVLAAAAAGVWFWLQSRLDETQQAHRRSDAPAASRPCLLYTSLGRLRAEERAAAELQILALFIERLVDQEILLLRADLRRHAVRCV